MFTGEYRHTVDDKGRMAVPVKFRSRLDPGSMVSAWLDNCLAIHTKASWDGLSAKIAALPTRQDITLPVEEHMVVELYSK